jgi:hypothetical protein
MTATPTSNLNVERLTEPGVCLRLRLRGDTASYVDIGVLADPCSSVLQIRYRGRLFISRPNHTHSLYDAVLRAARSADAWMGWVENLQEEQDDSVLAMDLWLGVGDDADAYISQPVWAYVVAGVSWH